MSNTPVAYHGKLVVKNGQIVGTKSGEVAVLSGMSFFWSNSTKYFYTAEMVDKMIDEMGCEVLRCAYGINKEGHPIDLECEPLIEKVVDQCIKRGVYVILDWHCHSAQNAPEEAVKFFDKMTAKYGKYDNVLYEVFNEPAYVEWPEVKAYTEIVMKAIRKNTDNLVLVGNPQWSQRPDVAFADPIMDENVAYTMHFYAGTHSDWLRGVSTDAINMGAALFISEWGSVTASGDGDIAKESTETWISWMEEHKLCSCNWAISDKPEGSSIFTPEGQYTETGLYIKSLIARMSKESPWKNK